MSYTERERAFYVQKMWSEGLRPATAARGWGRPSRSSLSAWERDALEGRLDCPRPAVPHACEHAKHGRYPEETRREALRLLALGKPPREVAAMLGLPSGATASAWARAERARAAKMALPGAEGAPKSREEGAVADDGARIAELEAQLAEERLANAVLRELMRDPKAGDPASLSPRRRVELGERLRRDFGASLKAVLGLLGLPKSTYEYHRARLLAGAGAEAAPRDVGAEVRAAFEASGGTYGYRRVAAACGLPQRAVRASMASQGLVARSTRSCKRWSSYAGELSWAPPNLLLGGRGHDFSAEAPNRRWVTDITEMRAGGAKLYLSVVLDLYDGRPVSWSVSARPDAELANSSLRAAVAGLRPGEAPLVHSDRGCHYRWPGWVEICESAGIARSMSRKGHSPDNAAMEAFFGRMKVELYHGRAWDLSGPGALAAALDAYCRWYSSGRLKSFPEEGRKGRTRYETIDGRRARLGLAV